MAGIGFALERLYRSNSITDRMASFAHASVIAAGPCLAAVLCIWLIGAMVTEHEGRTTIAAFRALVIYSFALSFVITAPIALVSARLISDELHDRDVAAVPGIMLATYALSTVVILLVGTPLFGLLLDLEITASVAAVANCALIALVWVACLFCSVTRDYNSVTAYFAIGMLVAVTAVTAGYNIRPDLATMLWCFSAGLGVTLFGLLVRVISTFPFAVRHVTTPMAALGGAFVRYWPIALGGFFGAVGAWIDKWVVWLSPFGTTIQNNLLHAPLYDSAMFVSYLVVDPGLCGVRRPPGGEVLPQLSAVLQQHPGARHAGANPRQRPAAARRDHRVVVRHHGAATADLRAGRVVGAGRDRDARHAIPAGRYASLRPDRRGVPVSVRRLARR